MFHQSHLKILFLALFANILVLFGLFNFPHQVWNVSGQRAQVISALTTYSVKKDGTGNFKTIQACAEVAKAGTTCRVEAGTYDERVRPVESGAAGSPISFEAAGSVKVRGFNLDYRNYINVTGFEITNAGLSSDQVPGILLEGSNHIVINNNKIHDTSYECVGMRNQVFAGLSSSNDIKGNTLTRCGAGNSTTPSAAVTVFGSNNLVDGNDISHIGEDFIRVGGGDNNVIRSNNLHDNSLSDWKGSNQAHIDGVQVTCSNETPVPTRHLLVENNRQSLTPSHDTHFVNFQNQAQCASDDSVIRYNTVTGVDEISLNDGKTKGVIFYNNTFLNSGSTDSRSWELRASGYEQLFNNIFTTTAGVDRGTYLTKVSMADSGNDQILIVDNPSFFQDGWAGVAPDWIAVGVPGNATQIESINYSGNIITISSPISRSPGDPIWLYKSSNGKQVLYGTAPDLGATELNNGQPATVEKKPATMTLSPSDTTPPSAPSQLIANLILADEVDLTWNASVDNVGISGYKIYRDGDFISSIFAPPFKDRTAVPNTIYTYTVVAVDGNTNESDPSNSVDVTTKPSLYSGTAVPKRAKTPTPLPPPHRATGSAPVIQALPSPSPSPLPETPAPQNVIPQVVVPVYHAPTGRPAAVSTDPKPLPDLSATTTDDTPFEFHDLSTGQIMRKAILDYIDNFKVRLVEGLKALTP